MLIREGFQLSKPEARNIQLQTIFVELFNRLSWPPSFPFVHVIPFWLSCCSAFLWCLDHHVRGSKLAAADLLDLNSGPRWDAVTPLVNSLGCYLQASGKLRAATEVTANCLSLNYFLCHFWPPDLAFPVNVNYRFNECK
jgi:hypothetical protein